MSLKINFGSSRSRNSIEANESVLLLGRMAEILSSSDDFDALERSLEALRQETHADDCELFLVEPNNKDLLLSFCQGSDREALMSQVRFGQGIGYPGIVVQNNEPIITQMVGRDERYIRKQAIASGIQSYLCVPLLDLGEGPIGTLHLAWHNANQPSKHLLGILQKASVLVSNAIITRLVKHRVSAKKAFSELNSPGHENWAQGLLNCIKAQTGSTNAAVFLPEWENHANKPGRLQGLNTKNGEPPGLGNLEHCSSWQNHQTIDPDNCPDRADLCLKVAPQGHSAWCLPIHRNNRVLGRFLLNYGEGPARIQPRNLICLTALTGEIGSFIGRLFPPSPQEKLNLRKDSLGSTFERKGLKILCFGGFETYWDGKLIPRSAYSRKKALTLLKILLLRAGKKVPKDELIETLWPETGFKSGANRLHGIVYALRSAIEPYFEEHRWIFIRSEGDRYYFDLESPHQTDLFTFQDMLIKVTRGEETLSEYEILYYLQKATDCYQGDLFGTECDGFDIEAERERMRQLYIWAVERLVELRIRHKELSKAATTLHQALEMDSLQEKFYQTLIKVLLLDGKRKDARAQYYRCVDILQREMDVEPLEETLKLKELI